MQGQGEAGAAGPRVAVVLVLGQTHRLEPLGEREGVAVVTPRRDPVASRSGIPGGVGPLDARPVAHDLPSDSLPTKVQPDCDTKPPTQLPAPTRFIAP